MKKMRALPGLACENLSHVVDNPVAKVTMPTSACTAKQTKNRRHIRTIDGAMCVNDTRFFL